LIRVEDGFVRSVGLGSDFLPPASLVFDSRGMYFDPSVRSDLEILLREAEFTPALVARARRLSAQLVTRGITKYNLAGTGPAIAVPSGRRKILVPGQVEDDLSIEFGGGDIRTNLALLAEARAANPDAYILYKPHPDVMAGHRKGAIPEAEARRFADAVVPDASTAALLDLVDELHTMTSLAGFEALLRGRRVVVYGRPFYAGWGLTIDQLPQDRVRHHRRGAGGVLKVVVAPRLPQRHADAGDAEQGAFERASHGSRVGDVVAEIPALVDTRDNEIREAAEDLRDGDVDAIGRRAVYRVHAI
jgi:capsular polysaccharide export protein